MRGKAFAQDGMLSTRLISRSQDVAASGSNPTRTGEGVMSAPVWDQLVRDEAAVAECPEKFIDPLGRHPVRRENVHGVVEAIGLLRQAAGKQLSCLLAGLTQDIKVDSRHRFVRAGAFTAGEQQLGEHGYRSTGCAFFWRRTARPYPRCRGVPSSAHR